VKQTKYKRTTYEETLLGDSLTPVEAKVIISKYDGEMEEMFLIDVVEIETKKMIKRGDL